MNYNQYQKAQKRIIELQELQERLPFRLSYDDQEELARLMEFCRNYADSLDADAQAEHTFFLD